MKIATIVFVSLLFQFIKCDVRDDCKCGEANYGRRIVNGYEVIRNQYPWMVVMLSHLGNQICGGSIISDRTILTAGHCMFYTTNQLQTKWMVETHSIQQSKALASSSHIYKTLDYEFHPKFRNSPIFDDYDMSVVIVDRPMVFNELVKPICLPNTDDGTAFYNRLVLVTGWGKLSDDRDAPVSDVLLETKVYLKTPETCRAMTQLTGYNDESMVCAHDVNTDACLGDSGGPLFAETSKNRHILLGVVSFGEGCATDFPGIYAKVDEPDTIDWLHAVSDRATGNFCLDPASNRRFLGRIWDWITGKQPEENNPPPPPETVEEGSEMPVDEGSEMVEEGSEIPDEGSEMPVEEGPEMVEEGSEMPDEGSEMPVEEGSEMPDEMVPPIGDEEEIEIPSNQEERPPIEDIGEPTYFPPVIDEDENGREIDIDEDFVPPPLRTPKDDEMDIDEGFFPPSLRPPKDDDLDIDEDFVPPPLRPPKDENEEEEIDNEEEYSYEEEEEAKEEERKKKQARNKARLARYGFFK